MDKHTIKAFVEKKEGKLVAVASTETKDRTGDIIKVSGWKLDNFKKNPVLLFAHKYNEPPIGIAKNIRIEGDKLVFEPVFHGITQLSREVKEMYTADPPIMRAFSVGFIPLQVDKEDRHLILESELLEISAVPVPANAEALISLAKSYSPEEKKKVENWVEEEIKECSECQVEGEDDAILEKVLEKAKELKEEDYDEISEMVIKPYPNEHACRLNDPGKYDRFARKNCFIKHKGKCIDVIFGIKAGKSEIQSFRYPKDVWTEGDARTHCKSHKGTFEPARKEEKQTFICECLNCGHILVTDKHCRDIKCPKCGGEMRRIERPGPGKAIEKGVIPYSVHGDCPKAPMGESWNAGVELKKASGNATRLRKMHAWVDTSDKEHFDPSERKWYKLPHHKGDGNQAVVWRGVAAAMAALFGARGGVKIPSNDRKGVYTHLARHYKQFGKEPPEFKEYTPEEAERILAKAEMELELDELKKEVAQMKEGRVLSGRNREIIQDAISSMKLAISSLQSLLKLNEPATRGEGKLQKGRREVAQKRMTNKVTVRALQLIAKVASSALHESKKENGRRTKKETRGRTS